ncbi:MAG: hypothetical protein JSU98_13965 [Gemmatimonadales bacterium]|jgi:hypothetical protein|nr:MAG: hypothetical protein JSU98_13965 [Gemmatimonadales bacterium]
MRLEEWLELRTPPVPEPFREWMIPEVPDVDASAGALAGEAFSALSRALEGAGRPRRGAFDLLAADGFLTYACEAALETDDPAGVLDELIERFAP